MKFGLCIAVLLLVFVGYTFFFTDFDLMKQSHILMKYMEEDLSSFNAAFLMIMVITLSTPMMMTTTPFNFSCGAIFGVFMGSIIFTIGATIGSVLNYLIAKHFFHEWATNQLKSSTTLMKLDKSLQKRGLYIIILSRLSPVFPFAMVGFVLGVTSATLKDFVIGTAAGLLPGVVVYSWMGHQMKNMVKDQNNGDHSLLISIILSVVSIIVISKVAQNEFDQATIDEQKSEENEKLV